jgi:hypothetical protein
LLAIFWLSVGVFIGTDIEFFDWSWLNLIIGGAGFLYVVWLFFGRNDDIDSEMTEVEFLNKITKDD